VLDGEEAARLRALLAEHDQGRVPWSADRCAVLRGCCAATRPTPSACCGTRSPGPAVAAQGFKRQTPVGRHIPISSRPLTRRARLVPSEESEAAAKARSEKIAWLSARDYRVIAVRRGRGGGRGDGAG